MPSSLTVTLAHDGTATFRVNGGAVLRGPLVRLIDSDGRVLTPAIAERRDVPGVARLRGRVGAVDVRVAIARVTDAAVVWRVDVTSDADGSAVVGAVATELEIVGAAVGRARRVPTLGAVVAEGAGVVVAHTFVPDGGPEAGGDAEVGRDGVGIVRAFRLEPGAEAGFTAVVAVGDSERTALEALFPFLSGERSRDALRMAHREALARAGGSAGM